MKTTTQLTSIALLTALSCSVASAALVTFDGNDLGGVQLYTDATNWDIDGLGGEGIPTSADNATATGRFQLNDGNTYELNSLTVNGGGSFISSAGTKLNITTDFTLNSTLAINSADFQWGGQATIGDGTTGTDTLSVIYGSHTNGGQSRIIGDDLDVAANGKIQLRWFTDATESSTVPDMDLSGDLTFAAGSVFEIKLDAGGVERALTEGAYFLVGSTNISGLPTTLDLSGFWTAEQAANSYLSIDTTNTNASLQGLYLNVIPEPGTYALLAGCFALASVMIRRRR